jgi:hypothetical protein
VLDVLEVAKAMENAKIGKAACMDLIPSDVFKMKLHCLFYIACLMSVSKPEEYRHCG